MLSSFKVSGPKTYTAEQIRLYIKVLSGAPIGPEFLVPFHLSEVINPLEEVTSIQKADEIKTRCMVLASSIDDPGAGEGLYAGKSFKEGHVLGKYWGCLALVLDSEVDKFNWFGYENRALLLKAQPFLHTELGPARLYVVGSLNCAMTYMNTVEDNTTWQECAQTNFFRNRNKEYIEDPKCTLNCIFEEVASPHYNAKTNTFTSWEVFVEWVFNGPTQSVLTDGVEHAEEVYACYSKEFTWAHPKLKCKK